MRKPPIDIIHLFPSLNEMMVSFLKNLSPDDWQKPTVARKWVVKDVAAHLLDGNFKKIASERDHFSQQPDFPINNYQDLVDFINQLNADWVRAARRLSPNQIIELLESTNSEVYNIFRNQDPWGISMRPVAWAGQQESYNWFDIAREYTERWVHQQQIRHAFGNNELLNKKYYHPLLEIFMQALPFTFRNIDREGAALRVIITGEGGGEWAIFCNNGWRMAERPELVFENVTIIDGNLAWKLFSGSVKPYELNGGVELKGDSEICSKVLEMVSVMA